MNQQQSQQSTGEQKRQNSLWQRYRAASKKAQIYRALIVFFVLACLGIMFIPQLQLFSGNSIAATQRVVGSRSTTPIQHIVIMDKENRTFDSMFGTFPGANGSTTYTDPNGQKHPLNHQPDALANDISHTPQSAHLAYDNGKMDKFSLISGAAQAGIDESDSQLYQAEVC